MFGLRSQHIYFFEKSSGECNTGIFFFFSLRNCETFYGYVNPFWKLKLNLCCNMFIIIRINILCLLFCFILFWNKIFLLTEDNFLSSDIKVKYTFPTHTHTHTCTHMRVQKKYFFSCFFAIDLYEVHQTF